MIKQANKILGFSLINFWILGFLLHLGFSSFFLFFSVVGIEYVYTPKQVNIECTATESLKKSSLNQVNSSLLSISSIHFNPWRFLGLIDDSFYKFLLFLKQVQTTFYSISYCTRNFWSFVQRGPPALV
ncbi:MAG: hypothetical protein KC646_13245 [Candidatus Cloacimonetes bacterium]|nr:hypothetical protein [Candidatus Cloacimonadota bacterium]